MRILFSHILLTRIFNKPLHSMYCAKHLLSGEISDEFHQLSTPEQK